jgi:hypothetical protein
MPSLDMLNKRKRNSHVARPVEQPPYEEKRKEPKELLMGDFIR